MRLRGTTIRRKIVALLLIPLVSLAAIWAFAATITGRALIGRPDVKVVAEDVGYPSEAVVSGLQQERKVGLIYIANPRDSQARLAFDKQEHATDASIAKLRTQISATPVRTEMDSTARAKLNTFLNTVEGIASLRQRVDNQHISRNDTYDAYNELIAPAFDLFDSLNPLTDATRDSQRRAGIGLMRAREQVSREDALMTVAISSGHMNAAELTSFVFAVANERSYYDDSLQAIGSRLRAPYDVFWQSAKGRSLRKAQDAVIAAGPDDAPVVAAHLQWPTMAAGVFGDLGKLDNDSSTEFTRKGFPLSTTVIIEAAVAGGLGLVAVVASIIVSVRIGRSLIRDLTGLRREAQEVSGTRLPRVMRRLAAGEQVDVETEVPRLQYTDDEIGQVGKALNTLQRTAVEAAVRQSDMRRGVSDVFVNLARRSQVLLHRQLTLLDAMERRTENAEELADLFRLDHMTTRMRRHAEGLVILSGAAPSRQWRKPVQLMDVVRAAVAEVEDYERIEVRRLPRLAVSGAAVADITHLLAELVENAAVFSPPQTQVRLHGEAVANGFVLEIDDRGLGLTPDALLEANLRLAETPEFELSDTDRLGLFVVSRLAQRHGVRVSLRQSPYGGTTAVVLIPSALLAETGDDTGSTRISEMSGPEGAPTARDTEHTFRQWGLDGAGGETHKEHAAHPDEPAALPDEATEPDEPVALPRRRRSAPVLISDHGRPVDGAAPSEPAPAAGAAPQPLPPVRATGKARSKPAASPQGGKKAGGSSKGARRQAADGSGTVLPRRVRQASLAPQLRTEGTEQTAGAQPAEPTRERSPDEVRDRMAALQRGWQRGREVAGTDSDDTATSVPRTTPEGNGR